ncbi:MAG: DUF4340 domain-containing protein [Treponema sp.]|nr:DUF4340 domain-containing protein [Treponema sp.]
MNYKKKIYLLTGIIAVFAITYVLTIIFDPENMQARSDAYTWLDPSDIDKITGITITAPVNTENDEDVKPVALSKNDGLWFVLNEGRDYPARQLRVEDFIALLSKRDQYPVRSSSASSHERLSLEEHSAVKVTIAAGAGKPVLQMLIGQSDQSGSNVFMRKIDQNEVRLGTDNFSSYVNSSLSAWYELRLFPENQSWKNDDVQRISVYPPAEQDIDGQIEQIEPMIFTRNGKAWDFNFDLENPDSGKVEEFIRTILETNANDFTNLGASDSSINYCSLELEFANGTKIRIRIGPPDENENYFAAVSGTNWVYVLPGWAYSRLFPEKQFFEKPPGE